MASKELSTIDVSNVVEVEDGNKDILRLSEQIYQACKNEGFFYVKPPSEIQQLMKQMIPCCKEFFRLPMEAKLKLKNDASNNIYYKGVSIESTGAGYRAMGADVNFFKDTRESFNIGSNTLCNFTLDEIKSKRLSGYGRNKWPSEEDLPGWRGNVEKYIEAMLQLSKTLRKLMALALGLRSSYFEQPSFFGQSTYTMGFVRYFPIQSNHAADIFGIRPHCDSGIFALLLTDGSPGLEICCDKTLPVDDRKWESVAPAPDGCLIVNLGKNLEYWTGRKFKATLHRVVNKTGKERFSLPFFCESNVDLEIKPLDHQDHCEEENFGITPGQLLLDRLTSNKTKVFE